MSKKYNKIKEVVTTSVFTKLKLSESIHHEFEFTSEIHSIEDEFISGVWASLSPIKHITQIAVASNNYDK